MSDLKITGAGMGQGPSPARKPGQQEPGGFDKVLQDAVGKVTQVQAEAEKAIQELAAGGDITQAIISMEKADMSFSAMVEVRNRLLTAYDEIMRMQI